MEISTTRLVLAPLTLEDMEDIHILNSYEEVAAFNTIGVPKDIDTTINFHKNMIDNPDYKGWSIRLKHDDSFIGIMGLRLAPARFKGGEIHYSILPDHWGKGFATEAVLGTLNYAFESLALHRIEAGCAIENYGSIKVLEKTGFIREGHKRKVLPLKTGWSDNYEYAILASDLTTNKNSDE